MKSSLLISSWLALFATTPVRGADLNDPKSTIQAWQDAYRRADATGIQNCFVTETAEEMEYLKAMANVGAAYWKMTTASVKRFGKSGANLFDPERIPTGPDDDAVRRARAGTVKIDGATATLTAESTTLATFRKVGSDWKLVFSKMYFSGSPQMRQAFTQVYTKLAGTLNEMAVAIDAGKFKTAADAEAELTKRLEN